MNSLFDDLSGFTAAGTGAHTATTERAAGAMLPGIVPANRDGIEPGSSSGGERGAPGRGRPSPDDLVAGLNPQQREAVEHRGSPLLIVAGAGSGKTRVLTHRIAHLLATGEARPGEILAITFTNKAAAEMRERVADIVGPAARMMWVSTFHSACVRIIRREHAALGLRSSFSIYDAADSQRLMQLVCREMDLDPKKFNPKAFSRKVSDLKNELVTPEAFAATVSETSTFDSALAQAYQRYQARLAQASALDFDDLIGQTVRLLQEFPAIKEYYRRRFRHVLVDEYQDTNHAQYVLVRELAGVETDGWDARGTVLPMGELTVVGDADQSIYAFRGATIRNILEFEEDYPSARTILLEQNYRSTQNILTAANAVISRNEGRRAKNLWTAEGAGEAIVGYVADSDQEESAFVVEEIDRLGDSDAVLPGDVAVFYRTNAQSRSLEERLVRAGIPYKVVGGTRFYERREIKDAIAYLHAVANPDDAVNVRRILNVPKRGLGERTEGTLAWFAERERISFGAAVERYAEVGLPARAEKGVAGFAELMSGLREMVSSGATPAEILDAALDRSGYLAELRASDDPQDASRVENLAELHAVADEFAQATPDGTLPDFLERVSLVADADQIPLDDGGQGVVTLMTVHTAKGLEFPVVFVTGLEDGTFPHARSLADPDQLAEERRLAYVALTRARQRLYLTRAAVRTAFGVPNQMPASRFLDDVPREVIEWRREESATEAMRRGWGSDYSGGYGSGGYGSGRRRRDDDGDGDFAPAYGSGARRGERGGTGPRSTRPLGAGSGGAGGAGGSGGSARGTAATRAAAPANVPSLAVGDRVTHDSYGMGTVVALEGSGSSSVAKVDFGSSGVKRLLLRYAPVTKL